MSASVKQTDGVPKKKIAILGGGVGAMTTAYELTNEPGWKDRYESITVYQMGWRLGGKGASGRGVNGRIEEHGLHVWLGFYNNAFQMIQNAYAELGRPPGAPLATWEDAFKKHEFIVLMQKFKEEWVQWQLTFPPNSATPGKGGELPSLWDYITMTLAWIHEIFHDSHLKVHVELKAHTPEHRSTLQWIRQTVGAELGLATVAYGTMAEEILATAIAHVGKMSPATSNHGASDHATIIHLLEGMIDWLRREIHHKIDDDLELRRIFILLDFAVTGMIGLLKDGVLFHPDQLDALDDEDFCDWLKRHGAAPETYDSPITRGWYDLVFAYQNGEIDRPASAAGTTIRCIFRTFFTYKGAIFWKMQAGMGDTIFGPLYLALKKRGVDFKFFHRVENLGLAADKRSVDTIDIALQAHVKDGAAYDPLVTIKGLECWPSDPDYDQLVEGDRLKAEKVNLESFYTTWHDPEKITLKRGKDFDEVVFGISLGSVPYVCAELLAADNDGGAAWRSMSEHVETVRTMAYQVWLNRDLHGLGWDASSPVMDAYVDPLNTWADMSQLIEREDWGDECRNISYFCGPMVGEIPPPGKSETPALALKEVTKDSREWIEKASQALWPKASTDGVFDWSIVLDTFYRANIDPSERYVLSVPGSTAHRLHPGQSGFDNLYLAGDWTVNMLNAGCVEAAVTSGMLASHALSGWPKLESIDGYLKR